MDISVRASPKICSGGFNDDNGGRLLTHFTADRELNNA
jgi:hypothetical protein